MKKKTNKILLLKNVYSLGQPGEIVTVKSGFSRNYLLPFKLGKIATKSVINEFASQQQVLLQNQKVLEKKQLELKNLLENIKDLTIQKEVISNTSKLFGKVTKNDILYLLESKLKSKDLIEKQQIEETSIEDLGEYGITIHLSKNIQAKILVNIISK